MGITLMAYYSYLFTKAKREAEEFMRSRNSIDIKKEQTTRDIVKFINDHYDYIYYNIIDKVLDSGSPDKNTIIYSNLNEFLKDSFGSYDQNIIDQKLKEYNILCSEGEIIKSVKCMMILGSITSIFPILSIIYNDSLVPIFCCIILWAFFVFIISTMYAICTIKAVHPEEMK